MALTPRSNEAPRGSFSSSAKLLLWVDDKPGNNINAIVEVKKKGVEVITAISTEQAMELLAHLQNKKLQNPNLQIRLITDMHRIEVLKNS
jgi:hypothetical protein